MKREVRRGEMKGSVKIFFKVSGTHKGGEDTVNFRGD